MRYSSKSIQRPKKRSHRVCGGRFYTNPTCRRCNVALAVTANQYESRYYASKGVNRSVTGLCNKCIHHAYFTCPDCHAEVALLHLYRHKCSHEWTPTKTKLVSDQVFYKEKHSGILVSKRHRNASYVWTGEVIAYLLYLREELHQSSKAIGALLNHSVRSIDCALCRVRKAIEQGKMQYSSGTLILQDGSQHTWKDYKSGESNE